MMRARLAEALKVTNDPIAMREKGETFADKPAHHFDFYNGVRLIISKEDHRQGVVVILVSAGIAKADTVVRRMFDAMTLNQPTFMGFAIEAMASIGFKGILLTDLDYVFWSDRGNLHIFLRSTAQDRINLK